jgi:hypothetical protein
MIALTETVLYMVRELGKIDIYPEELTRHHQERQGVSTPVADVIWRFPEVLDDIYVHQNKIAVHPCAQPYVDDGGHERIVFDIPKRFELVVTDPDDPNCRRALSYLPRFRSTVALRFPPNGHNDFIYSVWLVSERSTNAKQQRLNRRARVAFENGILPKQLAYLVLGRSQMAFIEGIDGVDTLKEKPKKELLNAKDMADAIIAGLMSRPFRVRPEEPPKPPKTKRHVRCPECDSFLTGKWCRKCGWKP